MVIERVGQIESGWAQIAPRAPEIALEQALMRLRLLQRALRRRLLSRTRRQLSLNRFDPRGNPVDFAELDALADQLWSYTDAPGDFAFVDRGDMHGG